MKSPPIAKRDLAVALRICLGLALVACAAPPKPPPKPPESPPILALTPQPLPVALCVQTATALQSDATAFAHATHEIVTDLFGRAPSPCLDAADVKRYETARMSSKAFADLPQCAQAPCLLVAEMSGDGTRTTRASIRVYDISDPDYRDAQAEYWSGRPLIFEDSAALPELPDRRGAATAALHTIAAGMSQDAHLRQYLEFAAATVSGTAGSDRKRVLLRQGASDRTDGADVVALFPLNTPTTGADGRGSRR